MQIVGCGIMCIGYWGANVQRTIHQMQNLGGYLFELIIKSIYYSD